MRKSCLVVTALVCIISATCTSQKRNASLSAQEIDDKYFNPKEVERVERVLSSDEMGGRKPFTEGIDKAADFISSEFEAAGLSRLPGATDFRQSFEVLSPTIKEVTGTFDGGEIRASQLVVISAMPELHLTDKTGFEVVEIKAGANLGAEAARLVAMKKNLLVVVDSSFSRTFTNGLARYSRRFFKSDVSVVFIMASKTPASYDFTVKQDVVAQKLANVVGMIPGDRGKMNMSFSQAITIIWALVNPQTEIRYLMEQMMMLPEQLP